MRSRQEIFGKMVKWSRYAARMLDSDPDLQGEIDHGRPFSSEEMGAFLDGSEIRDEESLKRALRELRKRVMLRIIARDLSGLADLSEVVKTASCLAEVSIRRSLGLLDKWMRVEFGVPRGVSGEEQQLHVIGMGKLGGGELNVSSDIDLIFLYPEEGETDGRRRLSCHEYFSRLGRKLIASLGELTASGFVFRVDMRLRPYGESGSLVASFSMLEDYLLTQGREWERYAWIKGRALTGNAIAELMHIVTPFVYRKYLDFGAYASMRDLHAQIRQQVRRREMHRNIKLGPGGIREIEFIAQVFQLIRGGRDGDLMKRSTLEVLSLLAQKNILPSGVAGELMDAYVFLRNLEHRLQYLDDAQTQDLPEKEEDLSIIAASMGFADTDSFLAALDAHRQKVEHHFGEVFSESRADSGLSPAFLSEGAAGELRVLGFSEPESTGARLARLRQGARYRHLPASSQKHVDRLVPLMVKAASERDHPDVTLARMLDLLEAVSRRAAYLALLTEYPHALKQVAKLACASNWASEYLRLHPILLDELLDTRSLYSPLDWDAVRANLYARLSEIEGDVEREMLVLRDIQHSVLFQLLVRDLEGLLKLEELSDHLSALADLMLSEVLRLCWKGLRAKHAQDHEFAIVGYGKLGGKELGYASDLDIIFLYEDERPGAQETYARLAQRINTWLTSSTSSGVLYETDLRLRPNGSSGLLVSSIEAFETYQMKDAWVWEHQALTRARHVAGSGKVGEAFEKIRKKVLVVERNLRDLAHEIVKMRKKMLEGHPNPGSQFDIKHDRGGIVDVEFIVQYLVLGHSFRHPELTMNSGNIALLGKMGEIGLIPADLAEKVRNAYRNFRKSQHRLRLLGERYARVAPEELKEERESVLLLWREVFASAVDDQSDREADQDGWNRHPLGIQGANDV